MLDLRHEVRAWIIQRLDGPMRGRVDRDSQQPIVALGLAILGTSQRHEAEIEGENCAS